MPLRGRDLGSVTGDGSPSVHWSGHVAILLHSLNEFTGLLDAKIVGLGDIEAVLQHFVKIAALSFSKRPKQAAPEPVMAATKAPCRCNNSS